LEKWVAVRLRIVNVGAEAWQWLPLLLAESRSHSFDTLTSSSPSGFDCTKSAYTFAKPASTDEKRGVFTSQ
jgi:hypothetical protein